VTTVVDASVAVKWFASEPGSDAALNVIDGREHLIAPETILGEVCNVAWRYLRLGAIDRATYRDIVAGIPSMIGEIVPTRPLLLRASEIAADLDHPIYDCFYLALAERESCRVLTADRRFSKRSAERGFGNRVRLLEA